MTVERGERTILRGLSFTAAAGEALVLVGPNGAGKTTLLRTIAGFLRPAGGTIRLDGGDGDQSVGEQSHFVGHANAIKANLTVAENVGFWAQLSRRARRIWSSASTPRLSTLPYPILPSFQRLISQPGRSAGRAWRVCWSPRGRSGCSTSRPCRSMPLPRGC